MDRLSFQERDSIEFNPEVPLWQIMYFESIECDQVLKTTKYYFNLRKGKRYVYCEEGGQSLGIPLWH